MGKGRPRAVEKGAVGQNISASSSGSLNIDPGPVYYPSEEEFRDPLEFIFKIRQQAEPYGICKIVPPKSWKPPFALNLDSFTFPTKTQAIHKLQARPAACDSKTFELEYSRFLENHCIKKTIKRVVFEGEELDFCKLFNAVKRYGGYDRVVKEKKWGEVARFVTVGRKVSECSKHVLSQLYCEHLCDYEEYYNRLNQVAALSCKRRISESSKSDHGDQSSARKRRRKTNDSVKTGNSEVKEREHDQICEQCRSGSHGEVMLLCDRCDKGWHIYCLSPPLKQIPPGNWYCFECLNSNEESFGFVPGKHYSLETFRRLADRCRKKWFGSGPVSRVQIEKKFWEIVEGSVGEVEVMYGSDLDTSVHGSGFPRVDDQKPGSIDARVWDEYSDSPWNLNNLPKLKGSMLRAVHQNITGVMVPWLYIGMLFSSFCWHFEDHCFYSMNYLHWGEPKCWYSVPGSQAGTFEKVMKSTLPDLFDAQPDLLFQLVTMLNPSVLQENEVPVYSILQEPGNFVITFPRSYHGGFNLGLNCAEAVNFAPADWLPHGGFGAELYKRYHKTAVLSHEELLCVVAQYNDCDRGASLYLKKELLRIYGKEKSWREKLWRNGLIKSSPMSPRSFPQYVGTEEDPTCIICQQYLYLSAIVCNCRPSTFVCLEHCERLCECKTVKLRLLYRHSLADLYDLVLRMENCTSEERESSRNIRRQASCSTEQGTMSKKVKDGLVTFIQLAGQWLLHSSRILESPFSDESFISALQDAQQFLWAGSEMDPVRNMVKNLVEAQKWAGGVRDCLSRTESWSHKSSSDLEKVHLETVDELLRYDPPPCIEPGLHKLKDYAEKARMLVQDIVSVLSICPQISELELLYSRACALPISVKESETLSKKISSVKVWLENARKCISAKTPAAVEVDTLYSLRSEILELQVQLPEIDMVLNMLSQAESCRSRCAEIFDGTMNLKSVGVLLQEWENFIVDIPELKHMRLYHADAVMWISRFEKALEAIHEREDQQNVVEELSCILKDGLSLKIPVDELPLVEVELKKASCREKAQRALKSKMSLEFIQQLMMEAVELQIEGEKVFLYLSEVHVAALHWEERAKEILSHRASLCDFEEIIRGSEDIFVSLPSLNDAKDALSEAKSWLQHSKSFLVSSESTSNSLLKVEDLEMLVSQSKCLKVSLEEISMLEIILKNCKEWENDARSLLHDAQCIFESKKFDDGMRNDIIPKIETLAKSMLSTTKSCSSIGFQFCEIPKLENACSTLQWCKKALSCCTLSPSFEDVLTLVKVGDDLSSTCATGTLLSSLIDSVKWLSRALGVLLISCDYKRYELGEAEEVLAASQSVSFSSATVICQLKDALQKHKLWQGEVNRFHSLNSRERSWSSILLLKERGNAVAFNCLELNWILSEVEKTEHWKKRCMDIVGISDGDEISLLHALQKIKQTLDRSLLIYGKSQLLETENLCICCFVASEAQDMLNCSTCKDCYHLQCLGSSSVDINHENYICFYCQTLEGGAVMQAKEGPLRFRKKRAELKMFVKLLSDAEDLCVWIAERDVMKQLVEQALACKACLREIMDFASAYVDKDIRVVFEELITVMKAGEVAGVCDPQDSCDLELAFARNSWKCCVNRLLDGEQKPTIQQIQKCLKEGRCMKISADDYYLLRLEEVKCLALRWAELAKKVATDSGALGLDEVIHLLTEGENLPVHMEKELKLLRVRSKLYCICRKPFGIEDMIACDLCGEWYHVTCMRFKYPPKVYICPACKPQTEESCTTSMDHERLNSSSLAEPKTPSPVHAQSRKKSKKAEHALTRKMFGTKGQFNNNTRSSSGIEFLWWRNRKPFRRAAKKRVELGNLSPFFCIQQ